MTEARIFAAARARAAKSRQEEKCWSILSSELFKMKKGQNDKNGRRRRGCRRCRIILSPVAKPSTQLPSRRVWLRPSRFSSRYDSYRCPRAGFRGGAKKQALSAHHCETFNSGESAKTICQPYHLPKTATADLFLFQRGEVEAGRPFAVPGWPHEELGGGRPNQQ
jgi:hypothetical protein